MLAVRGLVVLLVLVGVAGPAAADDGAWVWPLPGEHDVARPFAPPASTYGAGHRGVDLPSVEGAAVRASAAGRVTYAGLLAGRGVVVVTHGALRTTYEPVAASVRVGQEVALGELVGSLSSGHAGCPVAACLHWGLRRGEQYLDPVRLVERGPVRLLPLGSGDAGGGSASLHPSSGGAAAGGPATALRTRAAEVPAAAAGRTGAVLPEPAAPPAPGEPSWSLRAAEAPLGAAAVVALVLGVGLLARPRPPDDPVSGGIGSVPPEPLEDEPVGPPGLLLDLEQARARRSAS
ncbi:MAG: Peptidase [Frankiales bacterium]|nr:Peptidase [Frankiales bacterium]